MSSTSRMAPQETGNGLRSFIKFYFKPHRLGVANKAGVDGGLLEIPLGLGEANRKKNSEKQPLPQAKGVSCDVFQLQVHEQSRV